MRAFVTGGTGFLGANLIEQLLADGWQVIAMHRHGSDTKRLQQQGVELAEASLADVDSLRNAMPENPDAVFLNPCAIVGKYDTTSWAQTFFLMEKDQLPGVPPGKGSFCYAGSVARAHIDAFRKGRCGENYILAGRDASFLEFFGRIAALLGKPAPKRAMPAFVIRAVGWFSDLWSMASGREPLITPEKAAMVTKRVVASSDKAVRELGYQTDTDLDTMLRECYDWLVEQKLLKASA